MYYDYNVIKSTHQAYFNVWVVINTHIEVSVQLNPFMLILFNNLQLEG